MPFLLTGDHQIKQSWKVRLSVFAFLLVTPSVLTAWYLYSQNTLEHNGNWASGKDEPKLSLMGSSHFVSTRNAFRQNQLNLNDWHGYNEVSLKTIHELSEAKFRFRLSDKSYVAFLFNRSPEGFSGIRYSRHPQFPSAFFRATREGKFTELRPLPLLPIGQGWHRTSVRFDAGALHWDLDGRESGSIEETAKKAQFVGFRGGLADTQVDDLEIRTSSGETIRESFSNGKHWPRVFLILSGLYLGLLLAIWAMVVPAARRKGAVRRWSQNALLLHGVGATSVAMLFAFDFYFWSSNYLYKEVPSYFLNERVNWIPAVEEFRQWTFNTALRSLVAGPEPAREVSPFLRASISLDRSQIKLTNLGKWMAAYSGESGTGGLVADAKELPLDGRGPRLAFLGGSQTWGAGADSVQDTFVALSHRMLAKQLAGGNLVTFNLAVEGAESSYLLNRYRQAFAAIRPDLLVVNVSNNDLWSGTKATFTQNIRTLVELNQRHGIATVLVKEANSIERVSNLGEFHQSLDAIGAELGVPVWDMHGFLGSPPVVDSGYLWWDAIHLTSYGHQRVAEWLAPRLLPLLQRKPSLPSGSPT